MSFCSLLNAAVSHIFVLFWVIVLLNVAPKQSPKILSGVPKCRKAAMCFREKIRMRDNPVQAGVTVLLAPRPMLISSNTYQNKIIFNHNIIIS